MEAMPSRGTAAVAKALPPAMSAVFSSSVSSLSRASMRSAIEPAFVGGEALRPESTCARAESTAAPAFEKASASSAAPSARGGAAFARDACAARVRVQNARYQRTAALVLVADDLAVLAHFRGTPVNLVLGVPLYRLIAAE